MPDDLLQDPIKTISQGWGLFTSFAARGAKVAIGHAEVLGKTLNEHVRLLLIFGHTAHDYCGEGSRIHSEFVAVCGYHPKKCGNRWKPRVHDGNEYS